MSGCNPELVSAFLDGELDEVIVDSVTKHLLKCDPCCQMFNKLARVKDLVSGRFGLSDPESFTLAVMTAIRNDKLVPIASDTPLVAGLKKKLVQYGVPLAIATAAISAVVSENSEDGIGSLELLKTGTEQFFK